MWRIGAADPVDGLPPQRGAGKIGVARGPSGRIWAFWERDVSGGSRVFAARSNKPVSRFGTAVAIKPPGGGSSSIFSLEGEGTANGGMLDLIALVQRSGGIANYHQRIRPGISILVNVLGDGKVAFTTRDAGVALATTIKFGGVTKQTGSDGKVEFTTEPGKRTATATADGYHPSSRRVKVK